MANWYDTPANVTQYNDIFKEILLPPVRDQINREVLLVNQLQRVTGPPVVGKQWEIPLSIGRNEGVGAALENRTLPPAGRQEYDRAYLKPTHFYGRILLTGVVKDLTEGNVGSVANALAEETRGLGINMKQEACRMFYGDGQGILCQVSGTKTLAASGSDSVTVHYPWGSSKAENDPTIHVRKNMYIAFVEEGTAAVHATGLVTAVSSTAITFTIVSGGNATVDNDYVCRVNDVGSSVPALEDTSFASDPDGTPHEPYGLLAIVSEDNPGGSSTFMAVPSTETFWQATVKDMGAALSELAVQEVLDEVYINSQRMPSLLLTSHKVVRNYANGLKSEKRYVNTTQLQGGWTGVEINGRAMVADFLCPENCIFLLTMDELALWQVSDLKWIDDDGAILHRSESVDRFQATMKWRMNLGTYSRHAHGLICNITTT